MTTCIIYAVVNFNKKNSHLNVYLLKLCLQFVFLQIFLQIWFKLYSMPRPIKGFCALLILVWNMSAHYTILICCSFLLLDYSAIIQHSSCSQPKFIISMCSKFKLVSIFIVLSFMINCITRTIIVISKGCKLHLTVV